MTNINTNRPVKRWASFASFLLAFAVLLGAFGAHGLKHHVSPKGLELWQTATLYLFIHALALLIIAIFMQLKWCKQSPAVLMTLGMVLFSGSLYLLALGLPSMVGMITPIGGTLFVIAWLVLGVQIYQSSTQSVHL